MKCWEAACWCWRAIHNNQKVINFEIIDIIIDDDDEEYHFSDGGQNSWLEVTVEITITIFSMSFKHRDETYIDTERERE